VPGAKDETIGGAMEGGSIDNSRPSLVVKNGDRVRKETMSN